MSTKNSTQIQAKRPTRQELEREVIKLRVIISRRQEVALVYRRVVLLRCDDDVNPILMEDMFAIEGQTISAFMFSVFTDGTWTLRRFPLINEPYPLIAAFNG